MSLTWLQLCTSVIIAAWHVILTCLCLCVSVLCSRTSPRRCLTRASPGSTCPSWASPTPRTAASLTEAWPRPPPPSPPGRREGRPGRRWRSLRRGSAAWSRRNWSSTASYKVSQNGHSGNFLIRAKKKIVNVNAIRNGLWCCRVVLLAHTFFNCFVLYKHHNMAMRIVMQ